MVIEELWGCHGSRLAQRHRGRTVSGAATSCQVCSPPDPTWAGPPSCSGLTQSTWAAPASLRRLRASGAPRAADVSGAGPLPARQASVGGPAGGQGAWSCDRALPPHHQPRAAPPVKEMEPRDQQLVVRVPWLRGGPQRGVRKAACPACSELPPGPLPPVPSSWAGPSSSPQDIVTPDTSFTPAPDSPSPGDWGPDQDPWGGVGWGGPHHLAPPGPCEAGPDPPAG